MLRTKVYVAARARLRRRVFRASPMAYRPWREASKFTETAAKGLGDELRRRKQCVFLVPRLAVSLP